MRFVNRSQAPVPDVLGKDGLGSKEKIEACNFYTKISLKTAKPKKKSFDFTVYKNSAVKKALEKLFHGKCAYCESRYASIHPVDVEHWRPKAAVYEDEEGKKMRDYGYYWLAAEWDNLLPSCIDCNRERKHFDFLEKKEIKLGKGNLFPLLDPTSRATKEGDELKEKPLLLNPCKDNPDNYLEFLKEGVVKPKIDENKQPHLKAKVSIRVYALNRTELVLDRLERIRLIQHKMHLINRLAECLRLTVDNYISIIIEDLLSYELNLLNRFQQPEQPFSLMAKQLIDNFMESFKPGRD